MSVLVAYASKHGATEGIAERIGGVLRATGHDAQVAPVSIAPDPDGFEAVIVGSAVYMGHWMKEAVEFVHTHQATLGGRPLWMFSSGPVGPAELPEPKEIATFMESLELRDHRVFDGALDPHTLSLPERLIVRTVKAPAGDYRRWEEIEAWAGVIAAELGQPARPLATAQAPPEAVTAGA